MITVCKIFTFEAAHHLPGYKGPCRLVHGHSYKLEVVVGREMKAIFASKRPSEAMVMDFTKLKAIVKRKVIDNLDHRDLNEVISPKIPTAEILVKLIALYISSELPKNVKLVRCRLWETANSWAEWSKE